MLFRSFPLFKKLKNRLSFESKTNLKLWVLIFGILYRGIAAMIFFRTGKYLRFSRYLAFLT